jgi:hypothetical protein
MSAKADKAVLIELLRWCLEHDVEIWGCGCCGSPEVSIGGSVFSGVSFDRDSKVVECDGKPISYDEIRGAVPCGS